MAWLRGVGREPVGAFRSSEHGILLKAPSGFVRRSFSNTDPASSPRRRNGKRDDRSSPCMGACVSDCKARSHAGSQADTRAGTQIRRQARRQAPRQARRQSANQPTNKPTNQRHFECVKQPLYKSCNVLTQSMCHSSRQVQRDIACSDKVVGSH